MQTKKSLKKCFQSRERDTPLTLGSSSSQTDRDTDRQTDRERERERQRDRETERNTERQTNSACTFQKEEFEKLDEGKKKKKIALRNLNSRTFLKGEQAGFNSTLKWFLKHSTL